MKQILQYNYLLLAKRTFLILLTVALFGCSHNQKTSGLNTKTATNPIKTNQPFTSNKQKINVNYKDTTFLLRELRPNYYHKIYIEKNRNSGYYKLLSNFKFDKDELQEFTDYNKILKKKFISIKQFDLKKLPKEWLPLYKYKNKYYLYAPSDWGNVGRRIITNSFLIYWYMDGPAPFVLTFFKKISQREYIIKSRDYIRNYSTPNPKEQELDIYIIDKKNNIAVWEYKDEKIKDYRFQLFIPKENAKDYDIIVNDCDQEKVAEFNFKQLDFKKLIKGR